MKKLIYILGIICLLIIVALNITFTAIVDKSEHITITNNTFFYIIGILLLGILIYIISNIIDKKFVDSNLNNKKKRKFIIIFLIYAIVNII